MVDNGLRAKRDSADPITVLPHLLDRSGCSSPHTQCRGNCVSDFGRSHSLWMSRARIESDSTLSWDGMQGAEVIYVLGGSLQSGDVTCAAGGCMFIPAGLVFSAHALGDVDLLHYGSTAAAESASPDQLFGISGSDAQQFISYGNDGRQFVLDFFTDGTDPRTPCALFNVAVDGESFAPPHSHTRDEIIHVLEGEIRVGTIRIGAGTSIGVAHDVRYSFRTECPTKFLNFRNGDSYIDIKKGERSHETMAARRDVASAASGHLD